MSVLLGCIAAQDAVATLPLVTPVQVETPVHIWNANSVDSGLVSFAAGELVLALSRGRTSNASRTIDSITGSGISNLTFMPAIDTVLGGTENKLAIARAFWGIASAATGSGTLTANTSGNVDQLELELLKVTQGFRSMGPIGEVAPSTDSTSGQFSASYNNAPTANSLGILAYCSRTTDTQTTPASGWTEIHDTGYGSSFASVTNYKLTGLTQGPHTVTDAGGANRAGFVLEILQA